MKKEPITNKRISDAKDKCGLKQWQVAKLCGVSEFTFSRMMREELPKKEQDRIVKLIEEGGKTNGK